ncbi:MAG: DUF3150 domain-containing protein [Rhodanobacter sp.]|nr:DUF3150 domain-containing protein [Rhodanobacter sp.]
MATLHTDPLAGLVLVTADLRIWSGGVKLTREEDLTEVASKLPPKGMVSDGRKMLVRPAALAPFHAIRKRLERLLGRVGFKLMPDAWAIPETDCENFLTEVEELESEFNGLVPDFLVSLPRHYAEQEQEFPEWALQLRFGHLTPEQVESRMRFQVGMYRISPPADGNSRLNRRYDDVVNGAVPALLTDVADKATKLLEGAIGRKLTCTQAHKGQVERLVDRLDAFSFMDHRVGPTASALRSMMGCIPALGPLTPGNTAVLRVICEQLADPATALQDLAIGEDEEDTTTIPEPQITATPPMTSTTNAMVGF